MPQNSLAHAANQLFRAVTNLPTRRAIPEDDRLASIYFTTACAALTQLLADASIIEGICKEPDSYRRNARTLTEEFSDSINHSGWERFLEADISELTSQGMEEHTADFLLKAARDLQRQREKHLSSKAPSNSMPSPEALHGAVAKLRTPVCQQAALNMMNDAPRLLRNLYPVDVEKRLPILERVFLVVGGSAVYVINKTGDLQGLPMGWISEAFGIELVYAGALGDGVRDVFVRR